MVTTRKQSGKAAQPSSKVLEVQDGGSEYGASDEDVDEEFVETKKRKVSTRKSTTKRQKTSDTSGSTTKGKGKGKEPAKPRRRGKDLSLLPTMPLDVLYEILSQVTPKDLLNLSRTNHLFRQTMFDKHIISVWKHSREAFDAPDPPEGWTEQKWAGLLFETTCQSCGKKGVTSVDWYVLRRACGPCKKAHLVYGPRSKGRFGELEASILEYVPFTNTSAWTKGWSQSRFHWDTDVFAAAEEFRRLSESDRATWMKERTTLLTKQQEMVKTYNEWEMHMARLSATDASETREKRLEAFKRRFLEEGYDEVDIDKALDVHTEGIYTGAAHVSNAVWTRLRPNLEEKIVVKRNVRLWDELKPTFNQRWALLGNLYKTYAAQFPTSESLYFPPLDAFRRHPDFLKLLEADKDTTITEADFQPIVEKFGDYISEYHANLKASLAERLPFADAGDEHFMDRAKFVFSAQRDYRWYYSQGVFNRWGSQIYNTALIGWQMVGAHAWPCRKVVELRPGVKVDGLCDIAVQSPDSLTSVRVKKLIQICGLDAKTATIKEMDGLDRRLVCKFCVTRRGYLVFTWRAALVHGHYDSDSHDMRLASEDEEKEAKVNETPLREQAKAWSCNHCLEFAEHDNAESKEVVIEHLSTKHGYTEPKLGEDYFVNERCRYEYEAPYEIKEADPKRIRCFCFGCQRISLFNPTEPPVPYSEAGFRRHIGQRMVSRPFLGTDYRYWNEEDDKLLDKAEVSASTGSDSDSG